MRSILHSADLHLDSPFSGVTAEEAAARRDLQRQLPLQIAELANRLNCDIWLLAGDVFDSTRVHPETIHSLQKAFSAFRGRIFIAPGNHDPYGAGSPWAEVQWPVNVHIFKGAAEAVTLADLGCRIWGGGFTAASCREPLPVAEQQGFLEIGVFHGDPETDSSYRPITHGQIENCGLDYLALGHIHKTAMPRRRGRTWYGWPGVAMGRGFDETGPCGVFHVRLDGRTCETEFLPLSGPRYEVIHLPAGVPYETVLPADSAQVICRLILTGRKDGSILPDLSGLFHRLEVVDQTEEEGDIWQGAGEQTLRGLTLAGLKAEYEAADTEIRRQQAELAARYVIAALEGRESP